MTKLPESFGTLAPGARIADTWIVLELLGRGESSDVYVAEHVRTGVAAALKVLRVHGTADEDNAKERFVREARILARLSSPNTVRVVDFGQEPSGLFWIVTELLAGETLAGLLADHRAEGFTGLPMHLCLAIADGVLCALIEAHELALVHRDLRPSNIHLEPVAGGETVIKLIDFGVAKDLIEPMTSPGEAFGRVTHLSPEAIQGGELDARSDLYSLGVVLYECLTGTLPFADDDPLATALAHVTEPLESVRDRTDGMVDCALALVVERALAKRPDERWANAIAMRDAVLASAVQLRATAWKRFHSQPGEAPAPYLAAEAIIARMASEPPDEAPSPADPDTVRDVLPPELLHAEDLERDDDELVHAFAPSALKIPEQEPALPRDVKSRRRLRLHLATTDLLPKVRKLRRRLDERGG